MKQKASSHWHLSAFPFCMYVQVWTGLFVISISNSNCFIRYPLWSKTDFLIDTFLHLQVWTGLFVIDTSPVKISVNDRAENMVQQLLDQLQGKSKQVRTRCHSRLNQSFSVAWIILLVLLMPSYWYRSWCTCISCYCHVWCNEKHPQVQRKG